MTAPPTNQHPSFADATATRSVAENTTAGQPIGAPVSATRPDSVGTLVYSLGGTDAASFDIVGTTGQLNAKDVFNFETDPTSYTVTVSVTDGLDDYSHGDTVEDASIDVSINVTDVNEKPQFAAETASFTIQEDTPVGQNVGDAYTATDDDNDTVTYSVSGTDAALLQVDEYGQLQVKQTLDYEDKDSLTVIVSATDSKDDSGATETNPSIDDTITVTITLTNVFEAPRFDDDDGNGAATRTIPENTEANQNVGLPIAATDDEGDTLEFILGGTDATSFAIDTTTGQIKTNAALDHETKASHTVTVSVSDGKAGDGTQETGPTTIDNTINVTIEVEDINEKPAFNANLDTELEIAENTAADTNLDSPYSATDPDPADMLTYGLTGTDAASFDIDTSTGQIKTKAALDHETKENYSVTVTVSDGRNDAGDAEQTPATDATIDITITVTDEDDLGTLSFSPEQPIAGTTLVATLADQDGVQSIDTWQWEISADQSTWTEITGTTTSSIVPGPGDIGKYLRVTVEYTQTDSSSKTVEGEAGEVLTAPPTNQHPTFADPTATRSIAENTAAGQPIGAPVAATHTDNVGTLVYSLDATGAETFDIDGTSGQLKTKAALDYENGPISYAVTVSITDGMDDYSHADTVEDDSIDVTIEVADVNEPPAIRSRPRPTEYRNRRKHSHRNVNIGAALTATDPDPADVLTYALGGTDAASLDIDDRTGQIKTKDDLDHETKPSLSVTVSVSDGRDDAGTVEQTPAPDDTITVTITVTDEDDLRDCHVLSGTTHRRDQPGGNAD